MFGKEQESDGRKESREYHVHGVLGTKVFGKITLSAGVVVVGVARVGVVGQRTVDEWFQREFMDPHRIRHEFFFDTCILIHHLPCNIERHSPPYLETSGHFPPVFTSADDAQTLPPPSATANTQHLLAPDTRVAIAFILVV